MKTIRIISLHLAYGGVEKAIINMANMFIEKYNVEILSVYKMPDSPAFPLDERVKVRYLLKYTPNREEWKDSVRRHDLIAFIRESFCAVRTIVSKKLAVKNAICDIHDGIVITTRHEDNLILSRYGDKNVLKIAQLHHDHKFEKKYVDGFRNGYENIDVFALLAPKLQSEVKEIMKDNHHTKIVCIPNFLDYYPSDVDVKNREKYVLAVGRLDPVKGFDRLVDMFVRIHEKAPEWSLQIVGDGSQRLLLEKMVKEKNAGDYIKLVGKLDANDVEKKMRSASIYAMTSKSEGIPFVILEAQSCYLPCISFDVRIGPGALIENDKTGILVPDGDEDEYIRRMIELMNSQELRIKLGLAAKEHSMLYSEKRIASLWNDVLEGKNA